jgi:hypothetical protein
MWKWAVIVLIMMSLIGSVMWAMPTRREKAQALLRSRARTLGLAVQLVTLTGPRATGEADPEEYRKAAYRLLRQNLSSAQRERLVPWQVFRTTSLACEGLPPGWSWKHGERLLSVAQLGELSRALTELPDDVMALESTPLHVSAFWGERGAPEDLEKIQRILQHIVAQAF